MVSLDCRVSAGITLSKSQRSRPSHCRVFCSRRKEQLFPICAEGCPPSFKFLSFRSLESLNRAWEVIIMRSLAKVIVHI